MAYKRKNSEYRHLHKTPIYRAWASMKQRCLNVKNVNYPRYGGRGITICDAWLDFANFYKDMGASQYKGGSLDRVDVNGNYSPTNCKWSTPKEQSNNRRHHRMIKWHGQTRNLTQWGELLGIKSSTLRQRFYVYQWDINKCLTYNI